MAGQRGRSSSHSSMQLQAGPPPRRVRFVRTVVSGSASPLITRRHLWGNAPRRNSPRQSRPFCRPQTPRPVFALWHARTSLNLASLVELHASPSARVDFSRALRSGYFISIAVHFCGPASAGIFQPPTDHTICHSASQSWLPVSREVLITERPSTSDLSLLEMPRLSLPTLFRSSGPGRADVHGLDARAGGETEQACRAIRGPISFSEACPVLVYRDYHEPRTMQQRTRRAWQPGKDAKLRGVPRAVSSATRSRQADRNPNFQAVLAVSQPTVSHSL